jgi:catechol 2,3-dioxygenase
MGALDRRSMPAVHAAGAVLGAVRLNVAGLDRAEEFYRRVIGLRTGERSAGLVSLGAAGGAAGLIELAARPEAPVRPPGTTGLFHLAILVPSRAALGAAVRRVADAGWRLSGASDHLVSEAVYLRDPEGNGIEVYRDRPREQWRYVDGELQMDTLPLDLDGVLGEPDGADAPPDGMPAGTRIGHVHLNVADLSAAERFYVGALGFEVTVRAYPGALFMSIDGYHHHIGVNTWAGEGAPAPAPGSLGLAWFEVALPGTGGVEALARRLDATGIQAEEAAGGLRTTDPAGNGVVLRPRS